MNPPEQNVRENEMERHDTMKRMKLCAFADEADPQLTGQIKALTENQIPYIELRGLETGSAIALSDRGAREVRARLDESGVAVWSIGSPIGKIGIKDPFAPHVEQFRRTLEIGEILGAKCVRMFSFYMPEEDPDRARYRDEVMERLNVLVTEARGSGLVLCHENEKGIYGEKAPECLDIMQSVPGMRAVFDPANFVQSGQETLPAWEMLAPYVEYMHIKDALADGKVVPPGRGEGHVAEIVRSFGAQGGEVLSVEPHLAIFAGLSQLEREQRSIREDVYPSKRAAFDVAVRALREILDT